MGPDQTASLGADSSGFIMFAPMMRAVLRAFEIHVTDIISR